MSTHDDDDDEPMGYDHPQFVAFMDAYYGMREDMRPRIIRLLERVSALPQDVQATMSRETMQYMLDNDVDYPYN